MTQTVTEHDIEALAREMAAQRLKPDCLGLSTGTAEVAPYQYACRPAFRTNGWIAAPILALATALIVPYLLTHNSLLIGLTMQHAFSLVCHQRPERSFWLFGAPIAVCARCLGIYLGAAIGLLLQTSRRTALQLLIAAAALNLLDAFTEFAGLHGNWMSARLVLGLSLGAAAALLISSSMPATPTRAATIS